MLCRQPGLGRARTDVVDADRSPSKGRQPKSRAEYLAAAFAVRAVENQLVYRQVLHATFAQAERSLRAIADQPPSSGFPVQTKITS